MNDNELRSEDSLQSVKYLGRTVSFQANGPGVAVEPVRLIWTRSKRGRIFNRCAISIHPFGLCVYEEIAPGTYKSVWTNRIEDISYCAAELCHRRLFTWIARSTQSNQLECHLVYCKTSERARHLAEILAKTFHDTFRLRRFDSNVEDSSSHCSVCQTIARHPTNSLSSPCPHRPARNEIYDRISLNLPMFTEEFFETYEGQSWKSVSHASLDYDTTLVDDNHQSIRPMEFHR